MEQLFSVEGLVSLLTLTFLEIVLGIDNIIFISIISGRLPLEQQGKARNIGIILALLVRILMLLGVSWIIGLRATIFTIGDIFIKLSRLDFNRRRLVPPGQEHLRDAR